MPALKNMIATCVRGDERAACVCAFTYTHEGLLADQHVCLEDLEANQIVFQRASHCGDQHYQSVNQSVGWHESSQQQRQQDSIVVRIAIMFGNSGNND